MAWQLRAGREPPDTQTCAAKSSNPLSPFPSRSRERRPDREMETPTLGPPPSQWDREMQREAEGYRERPREIQKETERATHTETHRVTEAESCRESLPPRPQYIRLQQPLWLRPSAATLVQKRTLYKKEVFFQEERTWSSLQRDKVCNSAFADERTKLFPGFQSDLKKRDSPFAKGALLKGAYCSRKSESTMQLSWGFWVLLLVH